MNRLLSRALQLKSLWQIVSQINLEEIRQEVEAPFHLLIVADVEADALLAARWLSAADTDVHPWLTVSDSFGSGMRSPKGPLDSAVLVTTQPELSPALATLQQSLHKASIPCLVVVVGQHATLPARHVVIEGWSDEAVGLVASSLLASVPVRLHLALARRLPPLRPFVFQWLIQETSQANATYAFSTGLAKTLPILDIPLTIGDMLVLTKNQMIMAYKIVLVAGRTGTPRQLLGEIVRVLGGGFLFPQLAREMVGLIPVWGILPQVAIAYAGTWAIGKAVVLWAVEGYHLTPALLKSFYQDALHKGRHAAQEIVGTARGRSNSIKPAQKSAMSGGPAPLVTRVRRRMQYFRRQKDRGHSQ